MTSQNENPPRNDVKPSEAIETLGLYDDKYDNLVKFHKNYDDVNSDEKQKNFVLSSKMDVPTCCSSEKNYLINLTDISTDGQLKIDNNCGTQHMISSGAKSENISIRELVVNIKPLNTEADYSNNKLSKETCLNSKKDNCNSVVIGINLMSNAMDCRKIIKGSQDIETVNTYTKEHENIKDTIAYESNVSFNSDQSVKNVNVDADLRTFEIPTLPIKEAKQIAVDFTANNKEISEVKSQNSHIVERVLDEDNGKEGNCGTFGVTDDDLRVNTFEIPTSPEKEVKQISVDFTANNKEISAIKSQNSHIVDRVLDEDNGKGDNCGTFRVTDTSYIVEKQKGFNEVLNTKINILDKKNMEECWKSEKVNFNSMAIDINSQNILMDHKKSTEVKAANNDELETQGKSAPVYRKFSVLCSTIQNKETLKEVTTLASKTFPEVILISSTEEDNYDSENPANTLNETIGENYLNTNLLPHGNFHEELDNELEILKAQYFDIEEKLTIAAKRFTREEMYKSTLKVKKQLISCMESLEKMSLNLKNKWRFSKSQIPNEQTKPSYPFHQQYQKTLYQTPTDKFSYKSQAITKLTKIESHHHYEFDSPLPHWQTIETPHRIQKRPKHCSGSEDETCKNLNKKKCKLSQYSYERKFQQSPDTKIKSCSKKCCLSKNCTSYPKAKDTEFHSYRNELDCISGIGGFSKSFIARREMTLAKSTPKHFTDYCHSNQSLNILNPNSQYKGSRLRPCSAKKNSGMRHEKGIGLQKYGKYEVDFDLSDSSEISSISEEEPSPIPTDHKAAECCNRTRKLHIKSNKKNDIFSKKEKSSKKVKKNRYETDEMSLSSSDTSTSIKKMKTSGKRKLHLKSNKNNNIFSKKEKYSKKVKNNRYETDEMSLSNSDTNTSIEKIKSSGKRHKHEEKPYNYNAENKRVHNLVDRQMNFINKHVSRKADKTKPTQDSLIDPYTNEKHKEKKHFNKNTNEEETNSSEDMTTILENRRKIMKKSYEQPPEQDKTNYHSDLRTVLNDKHQNDNFKAKFHSGIASRSQRSISPVVTHTRSPYKLDEKKHHVDEDQYNLKNKYYTKSYRRMSPTSPGSMSPAEIQSPWEVTKTDHRNNIGQNNSKNKYNYKKLQSHIVPISSPYAVKNKNEDKDHKRGSYYSDEVKKSNTVLEKRPSDLAYTEDVAKNTVRVPEKVSGVTDKSVTEKSVKKKPVENKNNAFVSSGKFDLFLELNREIRKCSKKRPPKESKISNSENKIS